MHAQVASPPDGEKPILWTLLTGLEIDGFEAAAETVRFYQQLWRMEDSVRVLKSECGAKRMLVQQVIAAQSVVAWRLMAMTILSRFAPN